VNPLPDTTLFALSYPARPFPEERMSTASATVEPEEPTTSQPLTPPIVSVRWLGVVLCFAAVYLIWGSTYLAMKIAIESLPPFLMAGTRFLVAGLAFYAFARWRGGGPAPTLAHWRTALLAGFLLMLIGNGGVVWGQQFVPTSLAALLVTTTPLFVALFDWLLNGRRPSRLTVISLSIGMGGMIYLIGPGAIFANGATPNLWFMIGLTTIIAASFSWSLGSLLCRRGEVPSSPWVLAGMQMICGGVLLTLAGLIRGEPLRLVWSDVSARSIGAMGYLIVFGSWMAFPAFTWLMRNVNPTLVSTYAFVNPVVAVILGCLFNGEQLATQTIIGGSLIIGSVALMITAMRLQR